MIAILIVIAVTIFLITAAEKIGVALAPLLRSATARHKAGRDDEAFQALRLQWVA
jgi:hypothetical protein